MDTQGPAQAIKTALSAQAQAPWAAAAILTELHTQHHQPTSATPPPSPPHITRTAHNTQLDRIPGVGEHQPTWETVDCPACGTVPCSHPDLLCCRNCQDEWPCGTIQLVALELEHQAWRFGGHVASGLRWRAEQLRGELAPKSATHSVGKSGESDIYCDTSAPGVSREPGGYTQMQIPGYGE